MNRNPAKFWDDMLLKLPTDKMKIMKNKDISLADKIALHDCRIWPKWTRADFGSFRRNKLVGDGLCTLHLFEKAVSAYNLCLYYSNSLEERGVAYAIRSAAYFKLKSYKDCLDTIRLTKECPVPFNVMIKLLACEKLAIKSLLEFEEVANGKGNFDVPVELSYRRNKHMPSFVFCLKLKEAGNPYGGIITTENLLPGDVLVLEPSLTSFVRPNPYCDYCHGTCGNLQPCDCGFIMFCSPKCKKDAFEAYHNYECPLMDHLFGFPYQDSVIFRVFFKIMQRFKDVTSLREYLENIKTPNPFEGKDFNEWPSGSFESQFSLLFATESPSMINCTVRKDNLFRTDVENKNLDVSIAKTAIIIDMLKTCKQIPRIAKTTEDWSFLTELLFRLIFYKSFTIFMFPTSKDFKYVHNVMEANSTPVVAAICGSALLFKTSCQANVHINFEKNVLTVRALKNISRGAELLTPQDITIINAFSLKKWFPSSSFDLSRACHCADCRQFFNLVSDTPYALF